MRVPHTLAAYVAREVLLYAALGLAILTLVLVSRNLLRHLGELVAAGASAAELLSVLGFLALVLATYAVPVAFLFGVLLAMRRLATDAEITAMRSCGVGWPSLVLPVAALGLAVSAGEAVLTVDVEHRAQRALRLLVQGLAAEGRVIEPGKFRRVGERLLYVKRRGPDRALEGVLISDRSDPERAFLVFAESGELAWDREGGALHLRLRNGDVHIDPGDGATAAADPAGDRYRRMAFATFDYALPVDEVLGVSLTAFRPREMSADQLRSAIARAESGDPLADLRRRDPMSYRLQLERRWALPAAPLLFALVGVPLGARVARGGRSFAVLLCAGLAFAYYALLSLGQALAQGGAISAAAALWLPNAAFAATAAALLFRAGRVERSA